MKNNAIVVSIFTKFYKISAGLRSLPYVQGNRNFPKCSMQNYRHLYKFEDHQIPVEGDWRTNLINNHQQPGKCRNKTTHKKARLKLEKFPTADRTIATCSSAAIFQSRRSWVLLSVSSCRWRESLKKEMRSRWSVHHNNHRCSFLSMTTVVIACQSFIFW